MFRWWQSAGLSPLSAGKIRKKSVPLSAIVELDTLDSEVVDLSRSPEEQIMLKEQIDLAMQQLRGILSTRELEVFLLYTEGLSYNAIAQKLGVSEKSVDNALQRAKKKIQKLR
jgi:RNA polymerase sporulation-specific sigma factor